MIFNLPLYNSSSLDKKTYTGDRSFLVFLLLFNLRCFITVLMFPIIISVGTKDNCYVGRLSPWSAWFKIPFLCLPWKILSNQLTIRNNDSFGVTLFFQNLWFRVIELHINWEMYNFWRCLFAFLVRKALF